MKAKDRNNLNLFKVLASKIPNDSYHSAETVQISGEDLKLSGYEGDYENDKMYLMKSPILMEVNHIKRLKKKAKKHGVIGIIEYLKNYFKLEKEMINLIQTAYTP
jgi:hypothetical protein